jgi:mono/diheme cytochrome c family protein
LQIVGRFVTRVGLAVVFGWLTRRAWHANRRVLKWSGAVLAGLLTLVFAAVLAAVLVGYAKLNRKHDNPVSHVSVDVTPERIARGERFGHLCAGCHAADESPPMEGRDFLQDAPPIGTFYAPNLTPIHLSEWTDGEIIRAIREGVHRSGRSLLIMPSTTFRNLSDEDVQAIVAYLRSQPPVGPDTPTNKLNVLGALMVNLAALFEVQPPITAPVVAPPAGPTGVRTAIDYGYVNYPCWTEHDPFLGDLRSDLEFQKLMGGLKPRWEAVCRWERTLQTY